jgi:threonine synthase
MSDPETISPETSPVAESFVPDGDAAPSGSLQRFELNAERRVASDPQRPMGERIEAFETIVESEVGDTLLTRARHVEREIGLRQIYLKFEGDNPSGTQKDRIAFAQAVDALRRGFEAITVATCGNYGVAVSTAAAMAGVRCVVFIPEAYHTRRIAEMETNGAEVRRTPGDYEAAVEASREAAARHDLYDANPGGANTSLQLAAYGQIAYEIYDDLRDAPAAVAVPVSNGTTLAGIHRGFASLYRRGRTSRMPRMIAGSSFGKNPIVQAFLRNSPRCENLSPHKIRETPVNEALINWSSIDGDHALHGIRESEGWAANVTDKVMIRYARLIREQQGLNVLPASTAGLAALAERHLRESLPGDRYVVLLTGRRG